MTTQLKGFAYLLAAFTVLTFVSSSTTASAYSISKLRVENTEDFVVEPGKTEIFLNPGETVTRNISVTNRTNRPLDFEVGFENLIGSNSADSAVVLLPAGTETPYPLDQYVSTELNEFTLNFGEKITFEVTITTPADLEPGGHYGAIVISNESPSTLDAEGNEIRGGAQLTSRIGSLILMRINGDVEESGRLESFEVAGPHKWFHQKMPTTFDITYRNDGSVHLVPYGDIVIKNIFGADIAQVPVDAYFALPDSLRYQQITWPGKKFSFGFYSAELKLYKGYGNDFNTEKVHFFVLPLIIVVPVVLVFLALFGLIYFVTKKFELKRK